MGWEGRAGARVCRRGTAQSAWRCPPAAGQPPKRAHPSHPAAPLACRKVPYSGRRCRACSSSCRLVAARSCGAQVQHWQGCCGFGSGSRATRRCVVLTGTLLKPIPSPQPGPHLHHGQGGRLQAGCQDSDDEGVPPCSGHHLHLAADRSGAAGWGGPAVRKVWCWVCRVCRAHVPNQPSLRPGASSWNHGRRPLLPMLSDAHLRAPCRPELALSSASPREGRHVGARGVRDLDRHPLALKGARIHAAGSARAQHLGARPSPAQLHLLLRGSRGGARRPPAVIHTKGVNMPGCTVQHLCV